MQLLLCNRVDWNVEEEDKGHMACCTVQDLHQRISFAPDLGDIELLTNLDGNNGGQGQNNKCSINLDDRTGKYVPFLMNNNDLAYPEGSRILEFGIKSLL